MSNKIIKIINRKALHDYSVIKKLEAGIVLTGTEVKSIRNGNAQLKSAWIDISPTNELIAHDIYIGKYTQGNIFNHEERRDRKLLVHKEQIKELKRDVTAKGITIIPTKIYQKNSKFKVEVSLMKGKKDHDKRHALREKEEKKDMARQLKERNKR